MNCKAFFPLARLAESRHICYTCSHEIEWRCFYENILHLNSFPGFIPDHIKQAGFPACIF